MVSALSWFEICSVSSVHSMYRQSANSFSGDGVPLVISVETSIRGPTTDLEALEVIMASEDLASREVVLVKVRVLRPLSASQTIRRILHLRCSSEPSESLRTGSGLTKGKVPTDFKRTGLMEWRNRCGLYRLTDLRKESRFMSQGSTCHRRR